MICKKCGIEITSDKIWVIHKQECNVKPKQVEKIDNNDNNTNKEDNNKQPEKTETTDYNQLTYHQLKSIASSKNINTNKMKKEQLIEALEALTEEG